MRCVVAAFAIPAVIVAAAITTAHIKEWLLARNIRRADRAYDRDWNRR